jgi:hypothetical protein
MARRKAERVTERGERRAETAAVAAYLTALRAPKVPANSRPARFLEFGESGCLVHLCELSVDVEPLLDQFDLTDRRRFLGDPLLDLGTPLLKVAASWAKRSRISAVALREVGGRPACSPGWAAEPTEQRSHAHLERGRVGEIRVRAHARPLDEPRQ